MKRVLVFGMTGTRGGVESFLMNIYRKINKDRLQFDFLVNEPKISYQEEILNAGGRIYHIPMRSKDPIKYKHALNEFFNRHSMEYVAIWENVSSLANIDYLIEAYRHNIPVRVIHCHNSENMDSKLRGAIHSLNRLRIARYATDFWTCSDKASNWFYGKKIMQSNRYLLINNTVDASSYTFNPVVREDIRSSLNISDDIKVFGNIGRFHPQKNHQFLIDIFDKYHSENSRSKLLLIGKGAGMNVIKEKVHERGLDKSVLFLGERSDVPNLYQAIDSFIFPSKYEGMSIALLEAQAAGLPCVISTGNPPESRINPNVIRLDLNQPTSIWTKAMEKSIQIGRISSEDNKIIGSQYDSAEQTTFIEDFFDRGFSR